MTMDDAIQTNQQMETREGENTIYIGRKPTMNYVLAVVTQFNSGVPEVAIKARGNSISKAVDVKEIVINRFLPNLKEKSIKTSSEELTNEDGTRSKVSAIHIVLVK
jgi:archaea-specific DNA-binding protein